jgi:hypothetical protein
MMTVHSARGLILSVFLVGTVVSAGVNRSEAYVAQPWIDKIALELMVQKNMSKSGNFDPYFKQLEVVNEAAAKGDFGGKRKGMNRFLEMLETKEGGITEESAHKIFATVVKVTPYAVLLPLKSEDKLDADEKALIGRLKKFAAAIRDQDERAALSF